MSMFGNMFNSMSEAARNQGNSMYMPFGKSRVRIPLDALGRMAESRPPVRQGRTIYENFDLNHKPLEAFTGSGVSPEGSRMAADFRNYYRGFENLPYVRPATRPFLPGMGGIPVATRPFLPGMNAGGTVPQFDMNSAQDRQARDYINELNAMLGR